MREAIEATGAKLADLPPYSPEFNPIENLFAKIKTFLQAKAQRTVDALCDSIEDAIKIMSPDDCRNCFRHTGYS